MLKKVLSLFLVGCLGLGMLTCSAAVAESENKGYLPGTYTGTAKGFGGEVTVTVTVDAETITDVQIVGDDETKGIGSNAVEQMPSQIKTAQSWDVDGVAAATVTSTAIRSAAKAALDDASGVVGDPQAELTYKPGTYTGKAIGRFGEIEVEVTVSASKIESVTVTKADTETLALVELPKAQIPEDIVTYQSLAVDTVAGATASSHGIVNAVANALEQAGADVDALRMVPVQKELPAAEDMTTQVVVVGSGMSGLVAAGAAADKGADVVLLEKLPTLGGSGRISHADTQIANSEVLKEQGVPSSLEAVMTYIRTATATRVRKPDYEFLEYVLNESGKTADYLISDVGMEYHYLAGDDPDQINPTAGMDYTTWIYFGGPTMGLGFTKTLVDHLVEKNVRILTSAEVTNILMEGDQAAGVRAVSPNGEFTVHAQQVIIATGGASRDLERMYKTQPGLRFTGLEDMSSAGNTGDGHRMLEEIGMQLSDRSYIKTGVAAYPTELLLTWDTAPTTAQNMIVDENGLRFCSEEQLTGICTEMIKRGSHGYYLILDSHNITDDLKARLDAWVDENNPKIAVKGANITEIADKLGMSADMLKATYDRYQRYCAIGEDLDMGKSAANLVAYNDDQGLYAVYMRPGVAGSFGGALTDKQFRVQRTDGSYCSNLYAVGELANSKLHGEYYMGNSLAYYCTAGRIAGEAAGDAVSAK